MNTSSHLARAKNAINSIRSDAEIARTVRLEQDWIGNLFAKQKGFRTAVMVAKFQYCERHLATNLLKESGFIKHPVKRGLGDRDVWVIPANEIGGNNR